jgi:hemoglobin
VSAVAPASAHHDLRYRTDVHDLVVEFYREIVLDDLLAPIFGEVAEVDWARHIPTLIDYWCRVLFGEASYTGTILGPHQAVNDLAPFSGELFGRWNALWTDAIDRRWAGPVAEQAKSHAARISSVLSRRLTGESWEPPAEASSQPAEVGRHDLGGETACWAHLAEEIDGATPW